MPLQNYLITTLVHFNPKYSTSISHVHLYLCCVIKSFKKMYENAIKGASKYDIRDRLVNVKAKN